VIGIKQRIAKGITKRSLDDAQVAAFWSACEAIDEANLSSVRFGAMFKLLLLTGARRSEVAGMSDAEIKGDVWTIPAARTKNSKPLRVTLTKTAQAILWELPREQGCPYVFGPTGGTCSFGYSKAKARLDEAAKIAEPWSLHDLRRTMRTGLSRLGVREEIAERCINHPPGGLVGIYNQHKYEAEMAQAWQAWERHVLKSVD
jgi:integrase